MDGDDVMSVSTLPKNPSEMPITKAVVITAHICVH
jgi:hypothetical protein